MSVKLALQVDSSIYKIGDKVELYLKNKEEPIIGTLSGIFKSVWQPYNICINLKELPIHISIDTKEVDYIYKIN